MTGALVGWLDYRCDWVHETTVLGFQVTEETRVIRELRAMVYLATSETRELKVVSPFATFHNNH